MACGWIFAYIIGNRRSTKVAKIIVMHWHLIFFTVRSSWLLYAGPIHLYVKMLIISNDFSAEAFGPESHKFHLEPPWTGECFPHAFVWVIYIYIESIEVTCRSAVVKIVLIGSLRWPSSCLYLFPFHCAVYMYKIMILQKKTLSQFPPNFTLILLLKCDW